MSIYSLKGIKDSGKFGIYAGVGEDTFPGKPEVIKCAQHYAKNNHKSIFTYILYRIHQCALAIINRSDWQMAHLFLMLKLKAARDVHQIVNVDEVNNPIKWAYLVDGILSSFVSVYNQNNKGTLLGLEVVNEDIKILDVNYKDLFETKNSPFKTSFREDYLK